MHKRVDVTGKHIAVIVSGGNIDVNLISRIIEKGLVQGGRLTKVSVVLPDRPGSLARLATVVAGEGANVLSVEHGRGFADIAIGETEIEMVVETTGWAHVEQLYRALKSAGFRIASA